MSEFLSIILSFPALVPSVLLGVVVAYWLFVMVGALDIHLFSAGDGVIEGATKGVVEGAVKGAMEGAVKGVAEGMMHHGADVVDHGTPDLASASTAANTAEGAWSLLSLEHLRTVPVTVSFSVQTVFTWLFCVLGTRQASALVGDHSRWLVGLGVLVASFLIAMVPTTILLRPLARLFKPQIAKTNQDLVGRVCRISTGEVDHKFGQANLEDGNLSLNLQVRKDAKGKLHKGDKALIVAWDAENEAFLVEPYDEIVQDKVRRS